MANAQEIWSNPEVTQTTLEDIVSARYGLRENVFIQVEIYKKPL